MSLEEKISAAGHAAMSLADSIGQQFHRMQTLPVTRWEFATGTRPSFNFVYHDAELARLEALARKHPGAMFTMSAAPHSLDECIASLRSALMLFEPLRSR